jgi:hypothetical protein
MATFAQPQDVLSTIFQDASHVYDQAIERLHQGDLRDAAEKAWCAVNRATTALVLIRLDETASKSPLVTRGLGRLANQDPENYRELFRDYLEAQEWLHGQFFYWGLLDQQDVVMAKIRDVNRFIVQAERLAGVVLVNGPFHRPDCSMARPSLDTTMNWSWHRDLPEWTWYPSAEAAREAGLQPAICCFPNLKPS